MRPPLNPDRDSFSRDRLRIARYRAGLNLRELADRAGVSQAAVSQYESGRAKPSGPVSARIALACGVPHDFLTHGTRPVSLSGMDGTHFRSLRSTSKQARAAAWTWSEIVLDVADVLERYVQLPTPNVPAWTLHATSGREDAKAAAEHVRQQWQLPSGPVGHLVRHIEKHGILVCRLAVADEGIDAYSQVSGEHPVLILGTRKNDAARSRFDTAHELGHLVCHPEADPGSVQENQAHAFAAELLMPEAEMRRLLPRRFSLNTYAQLKQEWGVSIAALLYRARTLEVISDAAYRRAVMDLNQRWGRRTEPFPLRQPDDPTLIANAAAVAHQQGITNNRIADEAHLPLQDVLTVLAGGATRPLINPGDHGDQVEDHIDQ